MSELTPRNPKPVPARPITADEREVIRAHLFQVASLQALDEKTNMAVQIRVEQGRRTEKLVQDAVTEAAEQQNLITNPDAQGYMLRYRAETLMDMKDDVRRIVRISANVMEGIVAEPYEPYVPPPIERPLTFRERFFGRPDA